MNIREYINSFPREKRQMKVEELAKRLKVTSTSVRHWMYRVRQPDPSRVLGIEKITRGLVSRYDLRPDIYGKEK